MLRRGALRLGHALRAEEAAITERLESACTAESCSSGAVLRRATRGRGVATHAAADGVPSLPLRPDVFQAALAGRQQVRASCGLCLLAGVAGCFTSCTSCWFGAARVRVHMPCVKVLQLVWLC
jgi:hypothetical protein